MIAEKRDRIKNLEREIRASRQMIKILHKASAYFATPVGRWDGQHLSVRDTKIWAKAGIEPSADGVCDSRGNALAKMINGFYQTEPLHPLPDGLLPSNLPRGASVRGPTCRIWKSPASDAWSPAM